MLSNPLSVCQGVISLEPLGKKGYSVPKAGTIQVVSHQVVGLSVCLSHMSVTDQLLLILLCV